MSKKLKGGMISDEAAKALEDWTNANGGRRGEFLSQAILSAANQNAAPSQHHHHNKVVHHAPMFVNSFNNWFREWFNNAKFVVWVRANWPQLKPPALFIGGLSLGIIMSAYIYIMASL